MAQTDWQLIQACRQGEAQAWDTLLATYERLVYSIPLNYGLSHDDAADIAQITFTILLQSLENLRQDSRLGPWLATVAKRHTWRLLKRRQREKPGFDEDGDETHPYIADYTTLHTLERHDMVEWLDQGLRAISDRCRQLLVALYFDPKRPSYTDIAHDLSIPVGSIGPTRARCLQQLKQALQETSKTA